MKIDMEPSYHITIVEFFEATEANKIAELKNIEFDGRQLSAQMFIDFVAENVVPEAAQNKEGGEEVAAAPVEDIQ